MTEPRRTFLRRGSALLGTGVAAGLAGCTDGGDQSVGGTSDGFDAGYAAFFTLADWANEIVGDRASFEDPVDVGRPGHGWEPDGNLAAEVAATDAFVYLDTAEYPWAQDVAATLRADYGGVAVIDALDGIEDRLLDWDHGNEGGEEDHGGDDDHEGQDHQDPDDHAHGDEEDHDRGDVDPHVWTDPILAKAVVDVIASGLSEADPDGADDYAANADAYGTELDAVDETFHSIAADAGQDLVVLAGHDSFRYLAERYDFAVHSPVGVSPQNEPSQTEIAETIEIVNGNGIDVVLYDRFESPTLAETIVENSDATEAMAVSPAGGTLREWNERGYGYVEQMLEVNAPAFRAALDAA